MPHTKNVAHCTSVGACQCNSANGRLNSVTVIACHVGAMDFGIIVDGAVIVIENIMHRLAEKAAASALPLMESPVSIREVVSSQFLTVFCPRMKHVVWRVCMGILWLG